MIVVADTSPISYLTLGVIGLAADRQLVSLHDALNRLEETNFRASPRLFKSMREGTACD